MSGHEWKVLAAFGLLLGGLSLYDAGFAAKVGGVAVLVVLVKNASKIPNVGTDTGTNRGSSPAPAPSASLHV